MFTNQTGCTVWEKTVLNRAPAWIRHIENALYWQDSQAQKLTDGASRVSTDGILVIIPAESVTYLPKPDDRILSGIHGDEKPPQNAFTVMKVMDYRFSSPKTAHVEVYAE